MPDARTIAAIATPQAAGGIGIVRISGLNALTVADCVFKASKGLLLSRSKGYRAYHGLVWDGELAVDEAVCLVFRSPHSYTGEDTAEICCHGGLYVTQRVLRAVLCAGAEPAGPGEFTKRAYLNGKIGLAQAEAVLSMVAAQGEQIERLRGSRNAIIQREIIHDPLQAAPDLGISQRMFDAINATRTGGSCAPTTGGGIVCTVRRPAPTGEPIEGGDSDEGQ